MEFTFKDGEVIKVNMWYWYSAILAGCYFKHSDLY
jgi:hypothetical protein